jgi:preprotein translocase subunit YajC
MLKIFSLIFAILPIAAFANNAPTNPESGLMSFLPLILIFIIFYFLLIRPQQKKAKEHQEMVNNLKIGNDVCTASGIFGKVKKIDNKEQLIQLEIANNVVIKVLKASVNQVLDSKKNIKIRG